MGCDDEQIIPFLFQFTGLTEILMIIEKEIVMKHYQIQCDKCKRVAEPYENIPTNENSFQSISMLEKLARISGWDTEKGHVCGECLDAEYYLECENKQ